ncbi:MAG: AAA family ATPase, partial [Rikenellaceae bacterium]|nr:AAA family ATPase [Rikenellaceae bacterium]
MKLFLIGYMGCGKSSLGRKIAKACDVEFYDMDSMIE